MACLTTTLGEGATLTQSLGYVTWSCSDILVEPQQGNGGPQGIKPSYIFITSGL